jgi:hypothetical protein
LASKVFYLTLAAGIAFLAIGVASSIYSNTAVPVRLDGTVKPGAVDVMTPEMEVGSVASFTVSGSMFNITIKEPDGQVIRSEDNARSGSYDLTAQKAGEYRIETMNVGDADLMISGYAETKSSPLALSGALMLIVTGVIAIGLSLRFKNR